MTATGSSPRPHANRVDLLALFIAAGGQYKVGSKPFAFKRASRAD
jgi:hypothetical protein